MKHHGPQNVDQLLKLLSGRVIGGKAVVLWGSFGDPGSGKSEGNLLFGAYLQERMGGPKVTPDAIRQQLVFPPKDFPALGKRNPSLRTLWVDEGTGEGGHKRRSMSTGNVELAMDLDACRGRRQAIGWANPRRKSVDTEIQAHMTWAFEFNLDHSMTAWEADKVDPMFGDTPYFRERFTVDPFPWLGDFMPDVREEYLGMKDDHMYGRPTRVDDPAMDELDPVKVEAARQVVAQLLG